MLGIQGCLIQVGNVSLSEAKITLELKKFETNNKLIFFIEKLREIVFLFVENQELRLAIFIFVFPLFAFIIRFQMHFPKEFFQLEFFQKIVKLNLKFLKLLFRPAKSVIFSKKLH